MKNRPTNSRAPRSEDQDIQRPQRDNSNATPDKEPPMRFTDQDQELAAETVLRSDNPNSP